MKKAIVISLLVVIATAGGGVVAVRRLLTAQEHYEQTIARLQARLDTAERRTTQAAAGPAVAQPNVVHAGVAVSLQPAETASSPLPSEPLPDNPQEPVLMNAMREVVVSMEQCVLSSRTLRCSFNVINQSPAERKFILGVGGAGSRFEKEYGGASVFDDVGNDFLSAGGGVGNHGESNCDRHNTCEVEKTLTPAVRTPGWLRFDNVDARASVVKLLRIKWTDGEAWVAMDFRNIEIVKAEQ